MFFMTMFRIALGLRFENEPQFWNCVMFVCISTITCLNIPLVWVLRTGRVLQFSSLTERNCFVAFVVISLVIMFSCVYFTLFPDGISSFGLLALCLFCSAITFCLGKIET